MRESRAIHTRNDGDCLPCSLVRSVYSQSYMGPIRRPHPPFSDPDPTDRKASRRRPEEALNRLAPRLRGTGTTPSRSGHRTAPRRFQTGWSVRHPTCAPRAVWGPYRGRIDPKRYPEFYPQRKRPSWKWLSPWFDWSGRLDSNQRLPAPKSFFWCIRALQYETRRNASPLRNTRLSGGFGCFISSLVVSHCCAYIATYRHFR